jgi:aerobic carbon-monoxide dehydrogenase medium subunit
VIPVDFEYVRPSSVDGALSALAEHGDEAKLLAGGHSLLPMMKLRLATPAVLIDIARIPELAYIREDGDAIAIGAATRHADVVDSPLLASAAPLLPYVAHHVGDRQIRHRGTLGGSLVHADPAADLPSAALALGVTLVIAGANGRREVPVDEFFLGFFESAVGPDEILVEIRVPASAGAAPWGYEKFTRRANDWAIVAVAAVADPAGPRVALANMGPTPLRASASESALTSGASAADAAAVADEGTEPTEDMHATRDYRRHLARVLTRRALQHAGR